MKKKNLGMFFTALMLFAAVMSSAYAAKETKYSLTKELDRVRTEHDKGFANAEEIGKDDPHFGWGLGTFNIQGYTEVVKDADGTPVFLKNVGDELILGFDLKWNIDKLGKDGNVRINEDSNGYDVGFEVEPTDFGRGCLIVRETDYQNKSHKPVIYMDYLSAVQSGTANTKVKPFAEGDYEVTLDYELQAPGLLGIPSYTDYCIRFAFKIRNSNCMVFFYKLGENKDEITNGAVAEDGFKIDFKNSFFLTVNVVKEILVDNNGVLTLDTRFNKAASDGNEYVDEGLYTITVFNQYTKEQVTKKISVGHNKVLNVYAAHNGTLDLNEIAKQLDQGVEINDQWRLLLPEANAENSYNSQGNDYNGFRTVNLGEGNGKNGFSLVTPLNISIFALAIIVLIAVIKVTEKNKAKKQEETAEDITSEATNDQNVPTIEIKGAESEADKNEHEQGV